MASCSPPALPPGNPTEAFRLLARAACELDRKAAAFLKTYGLSPAQYAALRALRRAGSSGACCSEISGSMVTRDPDITRMIDRLEQRGWVERERSSADRRVIQVRLRDRGAELLDQIEGPLAEWLATEFGALTPDQLSVLCYLLRFVCAENRSEIQP